MVSQSREIVCILKRNPFQVWEGHYAVLRKVSLQGTWLKYLRLPTKPGVEDSPGWRMGIRRINKRRMILAQPVLLPWGRLIIGTAIFRLLSRADTGLIYFLMCIVEESCLSFHCVLGKMSSAGGHGVLVVNERAGEEGKEPSLKKCPFCAGGRCKFREGVIRPHFGVSLGFLCHQRWILGPSRAWCT